MKSQKQLMIAIIVVLVLINIGTLSAFWWVLESNRPPHLRDFFTKELNLTVAQSEKFEVLRQTHFEKGRLLHDSMALYKDGMLDEMLDDTPNSVALDSITIAISKLQIKLDKNMLQHYAALKAVCETEEQRQKLKKIFMKSSKPPHHQKRKKF